MCLLLSGPRPGFNAHSFSSFYCVSYLLIFCADPIDVLGSSPPQTLTTLAARPPKACLPACLTQSHTHTTFLEKTVSLSQFLNCGLFAPFPVRNGSKNLRSRNCLKRFHCSISSNFPFSNSHYHLLNISKQASYEASKNPQAQMSTAIFSARVCSYPHRGEKSAISA